MLLPGAGHAFSGEWLRGLQLLLPWGALLGLVYWAWERISAIGGGSLDDYIAIITLVGSGFGLALAFVAWTAARSASSTTSR